MLDRLATLTHCFWVCIKTLLHSLEQCSCSHRVLLARLLARLAREAS
jgi:hypothetical protein